MGKQNLYVNRNTESKCMKWREQLFLDCYIIINAFCFLLYICLSQIFLLQVYTVFII